MRVLSDGRKRRTEAERRSVIARFEKSGLSMSEFCRRTGVARGSLVKWKRRLEGGSGAEAVPARAPRFVEWVPPEALAASSEASAPEFELTLPGGVVLRWKA